MTTFVSKTSTANNIRMVLHLESGEAQVLHDLIETWLGDEGPAMECMTLEWDNPHPRATVESARDYMLGKLKRALKK